MAIPVSTGVDNIEWDNTGNLWTASHINQLLFLGHAMFEQQAAPSVVHRIAHLQQFLQGLATVKVEQIYVDDGSSISAASVAVCSSQYKKMVCWGKYR